MSRASALLGRTLFRAAAFVPPGYSSIFFAHLYENGSCPYPTDLFAAFRHWVLGSLALAPDDSLSSQQPVRVRSVGCPECLQHTLLMCQVSRIHSTRNTASCIASLLRGPDHHLAHALPYRFAIATGMALRLQHCTVQILTHC